MDMAEIGPITAALHQREEGKPPAICLEWHEKLKHPGQSILLWGGATKRSTGTMSWLSMHVHVGDEKPEGDIVTKTPPANVERVLSPLAHEGRIKIMQALCPGPLSASELSDATGLRGGALYHHLKELKYAAYVGDQDGRYRLTPLGQQLLLMVTYVASQLVVDEAEKGLAIASTWKENT